MFVGEMGKQMMIAQGYVPATCILHIDFAGPLIWSEVNAGRDVCAGCNHDREICHGRPKAAHGMETTGE